jgi:mevalonate kinase
MHGYGKIILFGEHAVVYGYPALAAGISQGIRCHVAAEHTDFFEVSVPEWRVSLDTRHDSPLAEALRIIVSALPATPHACRLEVTPEIPSRAGLGSSAALVVAIIKTLLAWQHTSWPPDQINELALQAEGSFHGTPSGIDNTVATFGGICFLSDAARFPCPLPSVRRFQLKRLQGEFLPGLPEVVRLVVVNTCKERETKNLVTRVREMIMQNPDRYHGIMAQIGDFAVSGYRLLQEKNYADFATLLNRNQECLRLLEVSCSELDRAAECARQAGAWGAKLTGAGGGGCLIAYGPQPEQLAQACRESGYETFIAEIR